MRKMCFEQLCWNLAGMTVNNYHSDNGVCDTRVFRDGCISKDQSKMFSGVGAKHQMQLRNAIFKQYAIAPVI